MTIPNSSGSPRGRDSNSRSGAVAVTTRCLRRVLGALAFFAIAAWAGGEVRGQTAADPALEPVVLIVDMQRIQRDSAAAQSIRAQSAALRQKIRETMAEREASIRSEERELAELRTELGASEFKERVRLFEEKVFEARDLAQSETAKLQTALSDATRRLRDRIAPILAEIMRERRAQVMLDSSQVVLSVGELEITDEVIERLDAALPSIELTLEPPPG